MKPPKQGDRVSKNGVTCYVHFVENGEVYGIRAPDGVLEKFWAEGGLEKSMDEWEEPKPWWATFRISLDGWEKAIGAGER